MKAPRSVLAPLTPVALFAPFAVASAVVLCVACGAKDAPPPVTAAARAEAKAAPRPAPEASVIAHVFQRDPASPTVSFRVAFRSGSSDDPRGREGLAYVTASLMAEGGTEALPYAALVRKLYPMAAEIKVHVDKDMTVFEATVARASLPEFYPLLRDVVLAPRLDAEGFERVRAQAAAALADDLESGNDEELAKEALEALVYHGHPYGHPVVGTDDGLAATSLADVRAHRARTLCAGRVLVGLAGAYSEGFENTVLGDMGKLPACDGPAPLPPPEPTTDNRAWVIDKPSAEAVAISIGFPLDVTRASDEFPALALGADLLGMHRQSAGRLFVELREKRGLNYGDYAYVEFFRQDGYGAHPLPNVARRQQMASLWIRPVKPAMALFALRGALELYDRFVADGAEEAELERFRTFLSRYRALEQQTETRRLGYAMDDALCGAKAPYLDRMRGGWAATDVESLKAVLQKHLRRRGLSIVLVGRGGADLAAALAQGAPSPPAYASQRPRDVTALDKVIAVRPLGLAAGAIKVTAATDVFRH